MREETALYSKQETSVEFLTATMFRTKIPLPANIPVGQYKVKSFYFGKVLLSPNLRKYLS
ncbi:hypothetical protein Q669_28830 [Labrenzia sp. C1B10]|nr:hypothetical protein Q669_28830 [Labrenzia sp. C1B10]ERS06893.1 hypothetical protein Q675_24685 [Labrenzia sp. C1B70]